MPVAVKDQQVHVAKSTPKADMQDTCLEEKGSLICNKQSQTIESLLPDEEDLFSGVPDELGYTATANSDDEDFDLFSSNGGIELEEHSKLYFSQHKLLTTEGVNSNQSSSDHVKNVDNSVEDLNLYDIRATEASINGLNGSNMLQGIKLEVNYPDHAKSLMQQCTRGLMQDQLRSCQNANSNSLPHVLTSCMKDEYIHAFPSTVGMQSTYNQFGHMTHYSTDQAFYPQSLPINCNDSLNLETVGFTPETNDKHLHMFGSYGSPMEHMFGGSSRNARSALRGHNMLNFSNSFQNHHHLKPVMWSYSYSPPFNNNGVCAHTNTNSNPKKCSFSKPKGRVRRTSHGRHETVSCHTDDKKFELDIDRVLRGEDVRTTLMIKNIPNKYSSAMLLAAINEHNQGTYDFLYLPLDFKNKCNMGYAFINMTDPLQIVPFHKSVNGKKWEKFHSGKVACLAYARIQGKAALIAHFQESSLLNEDKCCHPILFTTDGPNAGNQEPFPLGPNIQPRRHKNRFNVHKVNANQEMLSTSLAGELIIT